MREIKSLHETTLCRNCSETVIEFLATKGYDIAALKDNDMIIEHTQDLSESNMCEGCDCEFEEEEIYYIISIDEYTLTDIADRLSEDIAGCSHCEGYDRSSFVHAFNADPHDPSSRMDFYEVNGITVSEYLGDQVVPDELISLFAELLVCKCGYGREPGHHRHNPNGGVFDLYDDIYTKNDVAQFWGYEFDYEEFCAFAKRYGEEFSKLDLLDFREHLMRFPMLANMHKTGQAIFNALKKHYDAKDYTVLKKADRPFYRGRARKKDSGEPFPKEKMWAPPEGQPQHGRFNSVGVPVLYVSDLLNAIPYEIHPTHEDVLDIGEFQLVKEELTLFDLGSFDAGFQGFFNEMNEESKLIKRAYLLPNFIGTCCSYIGYNGVMYGGVHQSKLEYTNYGMFNIDKENDMSILNVRTYAPKVTIELEEVSLDVALPADYENLMLISEERLKVQ